MEKIIMKVNRAQLQIEFEKLGISNKELQYSLKVNKDGDFVFRTYNETLADKILHNFPYRVTVSKRLVLKTHVEYKFVW